MRVSTIKSTLPTVTRLPRYSNQDKSLKAENDNFMTTFGQFSSNARPFADTLERIEIVTNQTVVAVTRKTEIC